MKKEIVDTDDLRRLKSEPIGQQMARLPEMQPYIEYAGAVLSTSDKARDEEEAALNKIRGTPLDKRYLFRILTALEWGFSDYDSCSVLADLKTLESSEVEKVLEDKILFFRPMQFCRLLQALNPNNWEQTMLRAIESVKEDEEE